MSDSHKVKDLQKAFAAHIRNPQRYPRPDGIDEHRMQVYRDLFFNNISALIKQTFPVLNSLYNSQQWSQLIRDFYQVQYNKTPYFTEIAGEFLLYLKQHSFDKTRPYIYELAHYEWLELKLQKATHQPEFKKIKPAQLLDKTPIISPLVQVHNYHYPVHQIGPQYQPQESQNITHLLVWRDRDYTIHFAELNTHSNNLLKKLQNHDLTGRNTILSVFAKSATMSEDKIIEFGHQQLLKWSHQDIIISTQ